MNESKRLTFLRSFLKLYSVKRIDISIVSEQYIRGVAIYDEYDSEEIQEFIWYKTEKDAPSVDLIHIIEKIVAEKLHEGDKIYRRVYDFKFKEFEETIRDELINELLNIDIKMIDNNKETDSFFVHF